MKDLGMIFDSEHCKEKINTAYSYLGINRNFIYLDEDAFVMLYKSLVRSNLLQIQSGIRIQTWINQRSRKSPDACNKISY